MNTIGFPGFGVDSFNVDPVAIKNIFGSGRDIAWYGIFVTLGILGGIFYAFWRGQKNNGIKVDDMIDIAIFSIPAAIIGARLYYIVFKPPYVSFNNFYDIIAVWNGGLAVYGGIIFGFVTAFLVCKFKKISVLRVFDSTAPAIMLGQIVGRWGNFTNAEVLGVKTDLPWGMSVNGNSPVHPIFFYEILWNLAGFIIINLIYKKKKFDGQIFVMYIAWYGFGRMIIEQIRDEQDTLRLGTFRISQVVGFICFVAGIALFAILSMKFKNHKLENEAYEGVYSAAQAKLPQNGNEESVEAAKTEENTANEKTDQNDQAGETDENDDAEDSAGN